MVDRKIATVCSEVYTILMSICEKGLELVMLNILVFKVTSKP